MGRAEDEAFYYLKSGINPPTVSDVITSLTDPILEVGDSALSGLADYMENQYDPTQQTFAKLSSGPNAGMEQALMLLGTLRSNPEGPYNLIKDLVDGRRVMEGPVPNMSSIEASLGSNYEILPGLREVPMSEFSGLGNPYAVNDYKRMMDLAEQIKTSNQISPLIVAIDKEGPYILEGGHRADALAALKAKSFPALVVKDLSE